jgi:small-conductance mechanosensitive channel
LHQTGESVTGSYHLYDGTVEAVATGRELAGSWREASGREGAFRFVLSPEGDTFMGRFASGEWWTGTRLSRSAEFLPAPAVLASPRQALRSFLHAANAARSGFIEELGPALEVIAFSNLASERLPGQPPLPAERIEYARLLFRVLDQLTFRIWTLPDPSEPGFPQEPEMAVTLTQSGTTNAVTLRFVRPNGDWLIEPPAKRELAATLAWLLERQGGRLPGQQEHLHLRNPRDTMRTFVEEMRRFDAGGRTNVLRALDLHGFGGLVQEEDATLMAHYLKQILDRIGRVLYQEIPDDPGQRDVYVHFRHRAGSIVIAPVQVGDERTEWRFTGDTLRTLRPLYEAIESMPVEPGMGDATPVPAHFVVRDLLRSVAPPLLRPLGPMESWQWLALAVFFLTSVALAFLVSRILVWVLCRRKMWAMAFAQPRTRRALTWPLRCLLIGGIWYLKLGTLGLPAILGGPFRRIAGSVAIGSALWLLYRAVGFVADVSNRTVGTTGQQAILTSLSFGVLRVLVLVAGALLLADVWSLPYSGVLAGLGIGGLAVALAAQPTLQNMIAGFTLFADSPLSVGDFCRYGEKLGTLEKIGLRSTRIRTLDRTVVSLPNSEFANLQLENFALRDRILLRTTIQLRYETTPDQLRFVLAELRRLLVAHPKVHPDPARVRLIGFGAHSLDVEMYAYVATADWNEYLAVREDVFLRVMDAVRRSGTGFAFPSQVNYLARDAGNDPELTGKAEETVAAWREAGRLPFPNFPPDEVRQLDGRLDYPPKGSPEATESRAQQP